MLTGPRRFLIAIGIAGAGALAYFGMRGLGEDLDEGSAPPETHRPKIVGIAAAPIPPVPPRPASGTSDGPDASGPA
ncbi:MAG TPA: hypothetical protein VEW07_03570, partial [Solirubrobacterales bacterium]|nr:hypothetical protein [Solirubrobacterales bacterium]